MRSGNGALISPYRSKSILLTKNGFSLTETPQERDYTNKDNRLNWSKVSKSNLKANNFSDLERRLGIFPLHSENINKRFLDSPFIYILVPNLSVLEHYFKHFMHLNDKFGFSVFSAFKFDLLTFDQFSRLSLFV